MMAESEVESPFMNIKQAAAYLQMSVAWLYRQVALGNSVPHPIPVERMGRLLRFRKEDLDAWVKRSQGN